MIYDLPSFLRRKPSSIASWALGITLVILWGTIRLAVFRDAVFPLTYILPLVICIWTRRKGLLWVMAGLFALMAAIKFRLIMPGEALPGNTDLYFMLPTMINILVGSAAVHLIILLLDRLERTFEELARTSEQVRQQNEELAQQAEELSQQNEEVQAQSEELQIQSEDIQTLNIELSRREDILQKLLDSARLVSAEQTVITDLCGAAAGLFGDMASAVVIYEIQDNRLVALAQTGLRTQISESWPLENSFMDLTIRENRTACLHDTGLRPDLWALKAPVEDAFRSVLCAPVHIGDKPIGAVAVYCRHLQEWTDHQFRLAEWVADQCGNSLQTIRMQQAVQRQADLIDLSPTAIFVRSEDGTISFWSKGAEEMYGWTKAEALGRKTYDLLLTRSPEGLDEINREISTTGKWSGELAHRARNGREVIVQSSWLAKFDAKGGIIEILECNNDVSERKKAEKLILKHHDHLGELVKERTIELERKNKQLEAEIGERQKAEEEKKDLETQLIQAQKMEALGRFAGGIAHDLNNILYPIIINTEMLMDETVPGTPLHQTLEQMLQAAFRQRDLIKQILSFSRRKEKQSIPIKVTPLVEETLVLLRSSLPSTIEIRHNWNAANDSILGDPTQVQQIIMNLCKNAADSIDSKKGLIDVSLLNTDSINSGQEKKSGEYLQLTVEDSGSGMPPEVMPYIFEPFFTTKEVGKGSGMGLAVVHGILKNHGGAITVESKAGKGSRFVVYLPLTSKKIPAGAPEKVSSVPSNGKEKILLIDDEDIILSSVSKALSKLGYEVHPMKDSVAALELFTHASDAFDLVITDLTMPHMNGVELASKITGIRPDIPVVLCTGFSDTIDEHEAKHLGISELLMKPAGTRELKDVIRRALDKD